LEQFKSEDETRILILNQETGGLGLNLTHANHVIHFDRLFNPAKERQATDRTHRIGQSAQVLVHTIVASETIEDRIDAILQRKSALSEAVVGGKAEAFISELTDDQLKEFFTLGMPAKKSTRKKRRIAKSDDFWKERQKEMGITAHEIKTRASQMEVDASDEDLEEESLAESDDDEIVSAAEDSDAEDSADSGESDMED